MSDVNNLISLGIGSPASINHFVLFGLTPAGEVVFVPVVIVEGYSTMSSDVVGFSDVASVLAALSTVTTVLTSTSELE